VELEHREPPTRIESGTQGDSDSTDCRTTDSPVERKRKDDFKKVYLTFMNQVSRFREMLNGIPDHQISLIATPAVCRTHTLPILGVRGPSIAIPPMVYNVLKILRPGPMLETALSAKMDCPLKGKRQCKISSAAKNSCVRSVLATIRM
jgi:hypothetical protein